MRIVKTELGISTIDKFTFDDGIIITFGIDRYVWRQTEILIEHETDTDMQVKFNIGSITPHGKTGLWKYADYVYYIVMCHMSYVRFYKTTGEWLDPFRTQIEYHPLNDIKHRCHNLRKAGKFAWAHYDILRNIDEYNDFAKVSNFARESIVNFYSRFLKLSILNNNKTLRWILHQTESFLHYGFVMPDGRNIAIKCGNKEAKTFGVGCLIDEANTELLLFTNEPSDSADSFESPELKCEYQVPRISGPERKCEYQHFYKVKTRYNKRVGVRQKTMEIMKMQLTDDRPFEINGVANYRLFEEYADRMTVKSRARVAFRIMLNYIDSQCRVQIPTNMNQDIVSTVIETREKLDQRCMDIAVKFLMTNRSSLNLFILDSELNGQRVKDLYQIAYTHPDCINGKFDAFVQLMEKRKLMYN